MLNKIFIQKIPLFQVLRSYTWIDFKVDFLAGLTVGIIAFPQAVAFAILSGVEPVWGVYTAIIAGVVAALCGGSEHNVTGPTSAMALVLAGVVAQYGQSSAMTLALIIGLYQILFALFQLGGLVNFVPYPVLTGFSAGVAVIIFVSQLGKIMGISGGGHSLIEILQNLFQNLSQTDLVPLLIGFLTISVILILRRLNKNIPGSLIALILSGVLSFVFDLNLSTIGAFAPGFPVPSLDAFRWEVVRDLIAPAGALALLASVESVSTAAIAEKLTKKKFNSNFELFGQGMANLAISFFKGIPATGSFSRTAANIRSHAHTRFASVIHSLVILFIILFLGGFAQFIPLAALAGVLIVVAFQMIELNHISLILRTKRSDALVFLVTFFITLFFDLITAIEIGVIMSILLIVRQMSDSQIQLISLQENTDEEKDLELKLCPQIIVLEIDHPLFFAAASNFALKLNSILNEDVRVLILRMKHVNYIDTTGITILQDIVENIQRKGGTVIFSRMQKKVYDTIKRAGIQTLLEKEHYANRTRTALKMAMEYIDPLLCNQKCKEAIFKECPKDN